MMKVILTKTVSKIGRRGDLKNVKDGFYRNYLLPRALAVLPTPGRLKELETRKAKMILERDQMKTQMSEVLNKLQSASLVFHKKATSTGKLYAAITPKQIRESLVQQLHLSIPEEAISISEPLKSVGKFTISLRLNEDVTAPLTIEIAPVKKENL